MVISIIALLATIVLAAVVGARTKGRDTIRKETLKELQNALELYYNKNGHYPYDSSCATWTPSVSTYPPADCPQNPFTGGFQCSNIQDMTYFCAGASDYSANWIPGLASDKDISVLPNDPSGDQVESSPLVSIYKYPYSVALGYPFDINGGNAIGDPSCSTEPTPITLQPSNGIYRTYCYESDDGSGYDLEVNYPETPPIPADGSLYDAHEPYIARICVDGDHTQAEATACPSNNPKCGNCYTWND